MLNTFFRSTDVALQKLLAMVTELSSEVRDLRKEVQEFRQSCRCCQPLSVGQQVAQADVLEMPIRTMEEFECAEATLQTPEACKTLVTTSLLWLNLLEHVNKLFKCIKGINPNPVVSCG